MRHITDRGLTLIKTFEGFSPHTYHCPAGYPTIGYGHVVRRGESFTEISEIEAEYILRQDVIHAERAVSRLITVPLSEGQFDALVSFTFNLGAGALQRSTLRRRVNRHQHQDMPFQLKRWVWAGGRKLRGLIRRREAEAYLYQSALRLQ